MRWVATCAAAFAALLLACACAASATSGPAARPADAADMVAVLRAQESAWNAGDIRGFMSAGYWRSDELQFLSGGSWTKGYEPVLARYEARYTKDGAQMGRLSFSDLDPVVLAPDAGFVRGRWRLEFSDGKSMAGLFTLVMRRFPEGWRIVSDHTSLATD